MNAGKFELLYSILQRTLFSQFLCQIDPILLHKKNQHNFKRIHIDFEKKTLTLFMKTIGYNISVQSKLLDELLYCS